MDVFSHGLWGGILAKVVNHQGIFKKPLKIKKVVFWSVLPDIFAFAPLFIYILWSLSFKGISLADLPKPDAAEPPPPNTFWIFKLSTSLYILSHSLVVFLAVFGLVFLLRRRPAGELLGWLFHILIDIPTHSYRFYPTPFLWPISAWKLDGLSWGTPWFMALNYTTLGVVYYLFWRRRKNVKLKSQSVK